MSRKHLLRGLIILAAVVFSIYQLYPTYRLERLKPQADSYVRKLESLTGLSARDIGNALITGELEAQIEKALGSNDGKVLQEAKSLGEKLVKVNDEIDKVEPKAIKRGLDLQGGTFLIYEVDLLQLANRLARNRDQRFDEIVAEADREAQKPEVDFFDALHQAFQKRDLPMNRYFGKPGQSDSKIRDDLRKEAEDAIDRNVEIIRNRIDQFGVSEPTIAKQGHRRIVVELAGIQDVERAKGIIGKTALLEFKLEKDPQTVTALLEDIDKAVKQEFLAKRGPLEAGAEALAAKTTSDTTAAAETTKVVERAAKEKEISAKALFGEAEAPKADTTKADTTLAVDEELFKEKPFLSLLRNLRGRIAVPKKNMKAVDRILRDPQVQKVIPPDTEFLWSRKPERVDKEEYHYLYALKKEPELTGAYVADADVQIGGGRLQTGQPVVGLTLNDEGAKIFARVTGANVNKNLAIVLDKKVEMSAVIRERIPQGRAVIEGLDNMQEANDVRIVLKAGALPTPIQPIEERTVGPSLGQDSIDKGKATALWSFLFVAGFMVFYYRASGMVANVALVFNLVLLLAFMAMFHATLTMPGIAGIVLTIGMAVDANVLIFERIREELRAGKTIRAAIDAGYTKAFSAILDSNVTTIISGLVLYQFGTGPIKGFAVTLSIGIAANLFTAIVVTRAIFDFVVERWAIQKLSI